MSDARTVVFVHGWSVRHTKTYGGLPRRLVAEAQRRGTELDVRHVYLGRYVSFDDEVTVADLALAFDAALRREGPLRQGGARFCAVTHSTGGPVVREWLRLWQRGAPSGARCPLSHLVMLAPANFGSALAALGKGRLSRIKAWIEAGVEPGRRVLDWLELGSPESFELGAAWIRGEGVPIERSGCFPFVLTGQSIDRKLYDHLNSYTGELGSDGVVRVAAANLNAAILRLDQVARPGERHDELRPEPPVQAPRTAFKLVPGRSHSGPRMGILGAVDPEADASGEPDATADAVSACLEVSNEGQYAALCERFDAENRVTEARERVESSRIALLSREYVHSPRCMVVFRVQDERGDAVADFDLVLLAPNGKGKLDPNALPRGFFVDRQKNSRHPGTLTYFLDHEAMATTERLGLRIVPRPSDGFVHYAEARFESGTERLAEVLLPHRTALVDVRLRRIVHEGTFRLREGVATQDFTREPPGPPIG